MTKQVLYSIKVNAAFCTKAAFPHGGILFIFETFQAAGRDPSTSFLFIITNYEFHFLLFYIHSAQQFPQKYQSLSITTTSLSYQLNLSILPVPIRVHFSLTKISKKYIPIPSPTYTYKSLIFLSLFHQKCPKMA